MKNPCLKNSTILLLFFFSSLSIYSQSNSLNYLVELNSYAATKSTLPFWLISNKFATVSNNNHVSIKTALFSDFKKEASTFDFSYKASFIGLKEQKNNVFVDELYGSLKYKTIKLDVGVKHDAILWEGLSSSNGNITMSGNARSFPGYNITMLNYVQLPFAKKWLTFKGTYGDYLLNDKRFVSNTRLHMKSLFFKSKLSATSELISGINHYAQWGGTSVASGKQPSSFKDYLRIISGSSGGSDASLGEQINALGNHLGSYLFQYNYKGTNTNLSFYYSHLFEDRSGREFMNYPDALYGFFIDLKNDKALVTHVLTEFTYTKNVSGTSPHYVDDNGVYQAGSGLDDYFNNGVYQSGWTYFGNTIGSPYFTPKKVASEGITKGIVYRDRRFSALNIGFKGYLQHIQYKALLSHITYAGSNEEPYDPTPTQFSGFVELIIPPFKQLPFEISLGTAFDTGTYRPVNFGGFLKLSKRGAF